MEKIKVNMSPNPLDVQTIHASQNDGEARQWEFELHNNGELIDTSDVTEQLFFKAYKGGTEQILPENTSTPTTSPFKGDIKYPQGLLADQEFTYRQSPTEEDGLAKITDIKGNTLVWNQLVQNGNFAENVAWNGFGGTYSYADNVATLTATSASSTQGISAVRTRVQAPANHILLLKLDIKSDNANALFGVSLNTNSLNTNNVFSSKHASTSWETWSAIITPTVNVEGMRIATYTDGLLNVGEKLYLRNVNLFDLTAMGLDSITSVSGFTSLFPLSYYSYNQGSLLSFNGNGIKTVGKNLFDENLISPSSTVRYSNIYVGTGTFRLETTCPYIEQANLFLLSGLVSSGASTIGNGVWLDHPREVVSIEGYVTVASRNAGGVNPKDYQTILFNSNASDNTYEPYTSSTLSLPISTYFPTGMKSAGSVYDKLTESKAITRIGAVDLGSLTWQYNTSLTFPVMESSAVPNAKAPSSNAELVNCISVVAPTLSAYQVGEVGNGIAIRTGGKVRINIPNMGTDANAFKTAMSGVYLYYELATPTETSFTTASLVTENAEIPLSNNDGVLIGKCTEELSAEPGFHDSKIKLTDSDGECYSNKIQLHVERSPQ